ncbi:hypothetical protein C1645_785968 [Glomus cerebriforme]|uniref:Uncharacterized protein n=1 Tax=Glomus cerebriforme TaxID=658196 RepID=A0A397SL98_9GLOM|nr:hypothetical protein C1645_785968 [Glomus cerebriforme]
MIQNLKFSVLFMISVGILLLFIVKTHAYTYNNAYNKSEDDLYISPNIEYFMFPDGTKLIRFYRPMNDTGCNEPNLHLKLLHENGTLSTFNVQDFSVPTFNYCRLNRSNILSPDYIKISNLVRNINLFYIFYYNISDITPTAPFGRFVLEVNSEGNILSNNWLGPASYHNYNIIGREGKFKYIYDSYYYFQLIDIYDPKIISWQKFSLTPNGNLYKQENEYGIMRRDHLADLQFFSNPVFSFQTIDNGIGFIYSRNYSTATNLQPSLYVYANFYSPDMNEFTDPFIVYTTNVQDMILTNVICVPDTLGIGYKCILQLQKTTLPNSSHSFLLISFRSSGSIDTLETLGSSNADLAVRTNLYYGGYLLLYKSKNTLQNSCKISGNIYDNNNLFNSTFDSIILPNPCVIIDNYIDDRIEMISNISSTNFILSSFDLPKFINDGEYIYHYTDIYITLYIFFNPSFFSV